jgi:shikimate kinase
MTSEVCNDHILFVGFMGSGKTSVSRKMSKITGMSLIDIDYRIEAIEHRKIVQIFADEGEEGFRRIETKTLAGLACERRSIISCGGGIVCNPVNRPILKELGTVVFLDVPVQEAISRISRPETRPMLSGPLPVEEIYQERLPWYREVADITIKSSGMSVYKVACLCVEELEKRGLL